jgi:hypothetical protein
MKFRHLSRDKRVSAKRHSVAATVRQKPAVSLVGWRNQSEQRVLTQRAVAIATLGWRLRVQSYPIDLFAKQFVLSGHYRPQRTVASTGGGRHVRTFPEPHIEHPTLSFPLNNKTEICL